jgi:hypothetical protein
MAVVNVLQCRSMRLDGMADALHEKRGQNAVRLKSESRLICAGVRVEE